MVPPLSAAAMLAAAPAMPLTPPPPVVSAAPGTPPAAPPAPHLLVVEWQAGPMRCADGAPRPRRIEPPFAVYATRYQPRVGAAGPIPPVTLRFRIDAAGTPYAIARDRLDPTAILLNGPGPSYADSSDLDPALAAARFATGAPHDGCTITYSALASPLEAAAKPLLHRLLGGPSARTAPRVLWRAAQPEDGDCYRREQLAPAVRVFIDPRRAPSAPGSWNWAVVQHDVDAAGRVTNLRPLAGSDDTAYAEEARRAAAQNRFYGGGRRGCLAYFVQPPRAPLRAPPGPELPTLLRPGDTCQPDRDDRLARPRKPQFPLAFRRRAIEGWAILRFDIAPWGAVGNVETVLAEPAAAFGAAAVDALGGATRTGPATPQGERGCLVRVRFGMPAPGEADPD